MVNKHRITPPHHPTLCQCSESTVPCREWHYLVTHRIIWKWLPILRTVVHSLLQKNIYPTLSCVVTISVVADCACPALHGIPLWFHSALSLSPPPFDSLKPPPCFTLQPFLLSPCSPSCTGSRIDLCDVKATQATAATNKHKGLTAAQPAERGVCSCLSKYSLTVYDRVKWGMWMSTYRHAQNVVVTAVSVVSLQYIFFMTSTLHKNN